MACIFCGIARGEVSSNIIYEDDLNMVFLDIYPVSKGHLLVIPREHYESIHDTPDKLLARTWFLSSVLGRIYRVEFDAPGVNIVTNSGGSAGQVIFHFHVHVIPRWGRYGGFWSGRHRLTEDEAKEVIDMWSDKTGIIRDALNNI